MTSGEWSAHLTPEEIAEVIRTGRRPERPTGWSSSPDADAALDAEADAVTSALGTAAPPMDATASEGDDAADWSGASGHGASAAAGTPSRRRVPIWAVATTVAAGFAITAALVLLGVGWSAQAEALSGESADVESQIEELQ